MSGQIVIDPELVGEGLNEELLRKALQISEDELRHHLEFRLVTVPKKKKRLFWAVQAFLGHSDRGIVVGLSGYHRDYITQTIANLRDSAHNPKNLKGVWPRNTSFLQWLQGMIDTGRGAKGHKITDNVPAPKLTKREKRRQAEQKKQDEKICRQMSRQRRQEQLQEICARLPGGIGDRVRHLRQEFHRHLEKRCLLEKKDLYFLEKYGTPQFDILRCLPKPDSVEKVISWAMDWEERVKMALERPLPANFHTMIVLGLIASSPKYGVKTYAMWLGNSRAKALEKKSLDKEFRGKLGEIFSIEAIAEEIDRLIRMGWLRMTRVGKHELPVVVLADAGREVFSSLRKEKAPKVPSPVVEVQMATAVSALKKVDVRQQLLDSLHREERHAWISFLQTAYAVQDIALWSEEAVAEIRRALDEKMAGWEVPAQWQLARHPRKYKSLERLLS